MRHRIVQALAITALILPLMGALEPAEARANWTVGADFAVGGVYFSLGFNDFDRYGRGPSYYYRTQGPLRYAGHQCGSACYLADGYAYHHPDCPLVSYHFGRYGYDPVFLWTNLAPRPYGWGPVVYRSHYGPWSRAYRYDSHRYDRRYERRDFRQDYRRHDRRDDRHRGRGSHADSDSGRYDRGDRHGRGDGRIDRRDGRRDGRSERGRAQRSRSRSRDRD
jgi:hypothetical protein